MSNVDQVLVALRRIIRATDLHSKYLAKTTGLTAPQLLLLTILREYQHCTVSELANHMSLSQATVTTILDRLEKKNLIKRQRSDEDRRKVFALLTTDAQQILSKAPALLQSSFTDLFNQLEDWEQSLIISSMQRVATMMDANNIDAAPLLDIGIPERSNTPTE